MSILEIGKRKNITQMVMNLTNEHFKNSQSPFIITNKQLPVIEESAYIIEALENAGYKVKTFTSGDSHGIKISKSI